MQGRAEAARVELSSPLAATTTVTRRPVVVSLRGQCELVAHGLGVMLAPYADRAVVRVLGPGDDADVVLVDPFVGRRRQLSSITRQRRTEAAVAVYTWDCRPQRVTVARALGAAAFLPKTLSASSLVDALERVRAGGGFVDLTGPSPSTTGPGGGVRRREADLSAREAQVVSLIATGLSNEEIAARLFLSPNTLKGYIRTAYRKMGVDSRTQAVRWALAHDLLPPVPDVAPDRARRRPEVTRQYAPRPLAAVYSPG